MELQALLKRLRRSSPGGATAKPSPQSRPPDEGSAALGTQLGSAFGSELLDCVSSSSTSNDINTLRKAGCDIIDALSEAPSTSFAFGYSQGIHQRLCGDKIHPESLSAALETMLPWWLTWIEQSNPAIRCALIRGYVNLTNVLVSANDSDRNTSTAPTEQKSFLADAYSKLERGIDRRFLLRECVAVSFFQLWHQGKNDGDSAGVAVITNLSGLVARCMLLPTDARSTDRAAGFDNRDGSLFWTLIIRECRLFISSMTQSSGRYCANSMAKIVPWLVKSFHLYTLRLSWDDDIAADEAFSLFQHLCDLLCDLLHAMRGLIKDESRIIYLALEESYNIAMGEMLCRFSMSGTVSLTPCIVQLSEAMCISDSHDGPAKKHWKVSDVVIFRLASLVLNIPDMLESKQILESIYLLLQEGCFDQSCDRLVLVGSVRALGRIFVSSKSHATIATKLSLIADKIEKEVDYEKENGSNLFTAHEHIVRFFQTPNSSSSEFNRSSMLSKLIVPVTPESTSSLEQVCVFLVASSLLCIKMNNGDTDTAKTFDLMRQIVERWPYLGIRSIPLATSFIQAATDEEDGNVGGVISALHFLCSATAIDPSCAQQVWSIMSGLTEHPSVVRSASIRMFPLLCKANRKLYGRVRDCLGRYCSSPDVKTRISATATLCDLARDDLIRDVTDVIGWLQGCLNDEEAIVVYYVIMTLHHFIHGGELDFDVVIKVISKKLVKCDDLASILELSPVVVESLVVLLGDGAQSISDDSDKDDSSDEVREISPQVERAVSTLLALAQEYEGRVNDDSESTSALRILALIYSSLSGYNIDELGLDADVLRTLTTRELDPNAPETDLCPNYSILKSVVMDGLVKNMPDLPLASDNTENRKSLQLLATTILEFEEDILGPSLWKKQSASTQPSPSTKTKKQKLPKSVVAALPSAELLQSLYEENPSTGTAIARMFCLGEKSLPTKSTDEIIDTLADVLPDLNIAEIVDPMVMFLYYGSWLEAGKTLWTTMSSPDSNFTADTATMVIQQLEDLKETDHDKSLIALSAFCCVIPETYKGVDLTFVGEKVFDTVLHAHNGHEFTDSNSAMVAFGLLGSRCARSMAMDRVGQILDVLDDSGTDAKSPGALMSLALIARSLSSSLVAIGKTDVASSAALKMIGRIFALLMEEYHAYLDAPLPPILTLVASLRTGKASPSLLDSLQETEEAAFSLADTSHLQMKGVLIVLSVALPALSQLDSILLEGISVVLAKCPWNMGKGYALASAYRTLADQHLLKPEHMDIAYASAVKDSSESALFAAFTISQLMPDNQDKKNEVLSMMTRAIGSDNKEITSDDILNACLSVGTVPFIPDLDGPQLHSETTKSALVATVEILNANATDQHVGGVRREMSAIVLGILCCMKNPRQSAMVIQGSGSNHAKGTHTTKKVNELPSPRPFTLLDDAVGLLRTELLDSSDNVSQKDSLPSRTVVCDLIRCIGKIPLPAPFAILVKSIVNQVDSNEGQFAVKDACIDMMVSQIESERHSGSNRAEFISLSLQIAKSPPAQFWSLFQSTSKAAAEMKGMGRFMEAMSSFIIKWPSGVIEETIENLWAICTFDMTNQASFANASSFLSSLSFALRRCNNMDLDKKSSDDKSSRSLLSPVALKSIHSLLTNSILKTMVNLLHEQERPKGAKGRNIPGDVWSSYLACLEQIPVSTLNDADFFVLSTNGGGSFDDAIARILIIAHMVKRNADYFGTQTERHLMKAQLWIARQRVSSLTTEQLKSIRVAMMHLGGATSAYTMASQECRKEIILQCFETMLLNGLDTLALECLAVQCGNWCSSWCSRFTSGSSAIEAHEAASSMSRVLARGDLGPALEIDVLSSFEVSAVIGFFVRDMPWRLGSICRELGGTATGLVANRCLRILQGTDSSSIKQLEEPYDLHNAVLVALKESAMCCSEIDANGLAYTTFFLDEMMLFGGSSVLSGSWSHRS